MSAGRAGAAGSASIRGRPRGWRATYQPDRRRVWHRLLFATPAAVISLAFLIAIALAAFLAPVIAPHDPLLLDPAVRLRGPSATHWFGTDALGRDVFSRVIHGARVSLLVGVSVTAISAAAGSLLGLLAGYYRRLDGVIMRAMDGFMAFPGVLLAIAVVVSLGPHASSVVLALTLVYTPVVARLVRSTTLVIRELPYVESARATGLPDHAILWRYVFINSISPLTVQCTFIIAYAILAEASLSFLGASVSPETATWGNMLRDGQRLVARAWWIAVAPGTILFLTVLAFNLLGDALRDALDPRSRERREDAVVK
ncbi:MAG TPA: ABC transporter permease [Thermomicrobiales bacterium]|nr:ABC transporter permease [Thermomicrobiales bacterium]